MTLIYTEESPPGGGGGVTDHALLTDLDYAHAGHTGFMPGVPAATVGTVPLYDASGNLATGLSAGRLRRRDWLDPDPDAAAFAETCEFIDRPELGTVNSGNTAAGDLAKWTAAANTTIEVVGGYLLCKKTVTSQTFENLATATVNLTGDFDILFSLSRAPMRQTDRPNWTQSFGLGLVRADNTAHFIRGGQCYAYAGVLTGATYPAWAGGSAAGVQNMTNPTYFRLVRVSGTLYLAWTGWNAPGSFAGTAGNRVPADFQGWLMLATVADANTFTTLVLLAQNSGNSQLTAAFGPIRRYA